jgi:hypothetical protein
MSIANEIKEIDKYWNDLLFTVCDKDPGKMRELMKFNIFEFFDYLENYMKGK